VSAIKTGDLSSVKRARAALVTCRNKYKRIEYFMEYYFEYPVNLYNRAPVYEVEEPYMEYQAPIGLQVVEDLLMDDTEVYANLKELADQCEVISTTASDIPATLYDLKTTDAELLEANRLEMVRIMTLGITGYDAPLLKTGIAESATAFRAMQTNLVPVLESHAGTESDSVKKYLSTGIRLLEAAPSFDGFDRLAFITGAMLPLQYHYGRFLADNKLAVKTRSALNYDAPHLFAANAFDMRDFAAQDTTAQPVLLAALGAELFAETRLSGNGRRSCATCHQSGRYFTDGLEKSRDIDETGHVTRNAPTLLYTAYQHMQFHDGRAGSLEEQIGAVLQNPREMNANLQQVVSLLAADAHYQEAFGKAFNNSGKDSTVTLRKLAAALAAYEQTLAPFSSPFDAYLAGDRNAMNTSQIAGFNLFMGKAQCGTCHFAPVFNGLLPPYYQRTELEVLGVPQQGNVKHPRMDSDSGRYNFFAISFNNGAFKTSTVRNSAVTAPYMHNGAFKTLKQVIDFYNKGGGAGLKLEVENQTLSDKPIGLTRKETDQLVSFLEALTDKLSSPATHP
jgi:cytochrome c peroxidase